MVKIGEKFKIWTERENSELKRVFEEIKPLFKGSHGDTIGLIKQKLEERGIFRTKKGINRRLTRLGLKFYSCSDRIILKCPCGVSFEGYLKANRRLNHKQILCKVCQKIKNRNWDILNREFKLKYYREYYKSKNDEKNTK